MVLFRPADPNETVYCFELAFKYKKIPSTILMTRQNINVLEGTSYDGVSKGGYVISEAKGEMDGILLATGSEVSLAIEAQKELEKQGKFVRVVSMPSTNLFDMQSQTYRDEVLPKGVKTLAIEMGSTYGWYKYANDVLGIDKFGISAPLKVIVPMYGFTVENVVKKYLEIK
jgi:transketolase